MVAVPEEIPVTTPVVPVTEAVELPVLQVPPGTVLVNVVDVPVHTVEEPVIVPVVGADVTVSVKLTESEPQLFDTV